MNEPARPAQRPPRRPARPNFKGLGPGAMTLPVKFTPETFRQLRQRASYETMRWRLEHGGKGYEISAQDIVRRLVSQFFRREAAIPDDAVGRAVRERSG